MARFEGFDFYDIDSLLSEEERMVRDTVREWVEDRLMPVIGEAYIQRRFPRELIPEMGEMGMLGANLPEEYGCAGPEQRGLRAHHAGAGAGRLGDPLLRLGAWARWSCIPSIAFGSEDQRRTWLPRLA